jgi:pimeloyl-ACP methyl ester carboxylesterase
MQWRRVAFIAAGLLASCHAPGLETPQPRDLLIDIGGRRLHMSCAGTGSPAVILEAGLNASSRTWRSVQPSVADVTQVCSYDRAGLGTSDPDPRWKHTLRTSDAIVTDLHALLNSSGNTGPYVLVGHSLGGVHIRLFASRFPREVAGMVLVDSSHEDQEARLAASGYTPPAEPEGAGDQNRDRDRTDMPGSLKVVGRTRWRADVPLVVISHGPNTLQQVAPGISEEQASRMDAIWLDLQRELASRSAQGRLVVAERSGHFIQYDAPELVVDAIRDVVGSARKTTAAAAR